MGVRTFALHLIDDGYPDIEQQLLDWNYPCVELPVHIREVADDMFALLCNLDDTVGEEDYFLTEGKQHQRPGFSGRIFFTKSNDALMVKLSYCCK